MSDQEFPPLIMHNDEYTLWKELYDAVENAQKRGVSMQTIMGHVGALKLHAEYTYLGRLRRDHLAEPQHDAAASSSQHEAT